MKHSGLAAFAAATLIAASPFTASASDQTGPTSPIFNSPDITQGPWEIDGKTIFEINRELRAQRTARAENEVSKTEERSPATAHHESVPQEKATPRSYKLKRS